MKNSSAIIILIVLIVGVAFIMSRPKTAGVAQSQASPAASSSPAVTASPVATSTSPATTVSPTATASTQVTTSPTTQKENAKMFATISTTMGDIKIELFPKEAPKTVDNFKQLVEKNYYNGVIFHRVIPDFMIQGGDPTGTGRGGQSAFGAPFEDEINSHKIVEGTLAMANAGPGTNGSQFFIVTSKRSMAYLDGHHTVFGQVVSGLDVAYKISAVDRDANDKPKEDVKINSVKISEE